MIDKNKRKKRYVRLFTNVDCLPVVLVFREIGYQIIANLLKRNKQMLTIQGDQLNFLVAHIIDVNSLHDDSSMTSTSNITTRFSIKF